jgi:ABC-type transport system substrate-binding protein
MPPADDQELFDYSPDKCKEHLSKSSWDVSKPLRIIFDNTFAGVTLWTPVMQQNLEACGFKVDLRGFETTAAIEEYNNINDYEILLAQGTDQGVSPFKQEGYYNCTLNSPAVWLGYLRDCANVDDQFAAARKEPDPAKQTEIFKKISGVLNKAVDKTSLFTLKALSFKSKCLEGPLVPKNTREFIVSKPWTWTFTC